MINKIKEYFAGYGGFKGKTLTVDYSDFDENTVSFIPVPCRETVKRYVDGGKICQYVFKIRFVSDYRVSENSAYLITDGLKNFINSNPPDFEEALYFEIEDYCHLNRNSAAKGEYEIKLKYVYEVK